MIEISVTTKKRIESIDITSQISRIVSEQEGQLLHVYTPHTTCGVIINESADPSVIGDIMETLGRIAPADYPYKHLEGNSDAHVKSVLTGSSVTVPIKKGMLQLGTWQGIFFMEFDGPRTRKVYITVI